MEVGVFPTCLSPSQSGAKTLMKEVEEAVASSQLPETVDRTAISRLIAQVHLDFWK